MFYPDTVISKDSSNFWSYWSPGRRNWYKPFGAKFVQFKMAGGGGGGKPGTTTNGGGGGGCGAFGSFLIPACFFPDVIGVEIGAGGGSTAAGATSGLFSLNNNYTLYTLGAGGSGAAAVGGGTGGTTTTSLLQLHGLNFSAVAATGGAGATGAAHGSVGAGFPLVGGGGGGGNGAFAGGDVNLGYGITELKTLGGGADQNGQNGSISYNPVFISYGGGGAGGTVAASTGMTGGNAGPGSGGGGGGRGATTGGNGGLGGDGFALIWSHN